MIRCRACDAVLMAFVTIRSVTCVDLLGLASLPGSLPGAVLAAAGGSGAAVGLR